MPCHHLLDEYLTAYLGATDAGGTPGTAKAPLFRALSRRTTRLGDSRSLSPTLSP